MTRTLIAVADDGGAGEARDRGILDAVDAGVVRTVAVLANGPTAPALAGELRRRPGLSVLLHLNLTELAALVPGHRTLAGPCDRFLGDKQAFWHRAHGGLVDPAEVAAEGARQLARLRELGLDPVGLNGHNHVHVLPGVREGVFRLLAREPALRWIRIPAEPEPPEGAAPPVAEPAMPCPEKSLDPVARRMLERGHTALASVRVLAAATVHGLPGRVRFADTFLGFAFGSTGSRAVLEAGLRAAPGPVVELMVHPGRADDEAPTAFGRSAHREAEREVLADPAFAGFLRAEGYEVASA